MAPPNQIENGAVMRISPPSAQHPDELRRQACHGQVAGEASGCERRESSKGAQFGQVKVA